MVLSLHFACLGVTVCENITHLSLLHENCPEFQEILSILENLDDFLTYETKFYTNIYETSETFPIKALENKTAWPHV